MNALKPFHPPTQEAMAVKPWRNAQRVSAEACGEGGHASAGVAEDKKGTTAVKPWGSTDYTLSDWVADAKLVLDMLNNGPHLTHTPQASSHPPAPSRPSQAPLPRDAPLPQVTIVGNSLGGWIAWMMAREFPVVKELILIAPAFNMMGVRAKQISEERQHAWHTAGWMPWDDDPGHRDYPIAWKWVEESEALWKTSFDRLRRVKTTILHGLQDTAILPCGSSEFVDQLLARDPAFPIELNLIPGDHRVSSPEHLDIFRRLVQRAI